MDVPILRRYLSVVSNIMIGVTMRTQIRGMESTVEVKDACDPLAEAAEEQEASLPRSPHQENTARFFPRAGLCRLP